MKNKFFVWLFSIGIVIVIAIIGFVVRKSISIYNKTEIIETSVLTNDSTYNVTNNMYKLDSYLIYLQEYLRTSEVNLTVEDVNRKEYLQQELISIANIEKENNIRNMTIDGREIAISLLNNIYAVYGMNISFGLDGEIQKVNDPLGNMIYHNVEHTLQAKNQIINFSIIICIGLLLIGLSVYIGKKSKIIIKDVEIYGLDKKKYA